MPESPITRDNQKHNAKKKHQFNLMNLAIIIKSATIHIIFQQLNYLYIDDFKSTYRGRKTSSVLVN
jgi:hypothetical protein